MARTELPHGIILPAEYSDDWYDDMTSNLSKLDEVIGSDAEKLSDEDVGAAALSNDYDDLDNKPALKPVATSGDYDDLDNKPDLKPVATSGDYDDLDNKPDLKPVATSGDYDDLDNKPDLKPVATSGDYDDLTDLPTYGITRYCSSAITDNSSVAFSAISNTNKIKVGDFLLDTTGKMYQISSVDTANETVSVTTPLTQLAVDSGVMHLSGDETASGIKSFSNDTFITSLNFTNEVPSPSSSSSSIMPIITTITYGDSSPSVQARLNLRVTADSSKSFYPHEAGLYSLGLASRYWDVVYSYMYDSNGKYLGNEFSNNARTNLYLKANRDTNGQSGVYVSKFRQNRPQGGMGDSDVVQLIFDVLENSVRTNRSWYLNWVNWENDVPKTVEVRSLCEKVDYKLTHINGVEPSALGMPDLDNAVDISGYITAGNAHNEYTPLVNGWISVIIKSTSGACAVFIYQGYWGNGYYGSTSLPNESEPCAMANLPVKAGTVVSIDIKGSNNYVYSAKFYPCLGNV